jgi:hypothetical protein
MLLREIVLLVDMKGAVLELGEIQCRRRVIAMSARQVLAIWSRGLPGGWACIGLPKNSSGPPENRVDAGAGSGH